MNFVFLLFVILPLLCFHAFILHFGTFTIDLFRIYIFPKQTEIPIPEIANTQTAKCQDMETATHEVIPVYIWSKRNQSKFPGDI